MIKAQRKTIERIDRSIRAWGDPQKVLIAGCGTCVSICFAGGEQEVELLASALRLKAVTDGKSVPSIAEATPQRQCEKEFNEFMAAEVEAADVVVSIACGVGVQVLAERFPEKRVVPGLDTTFMGPPAAHGVWFENCQGCGSCVLGYTAGICPIARCAKSMLNGPCGGSQGGRCEVDREMPCGWQLILDGQKRQGRMADMDYLVAAKDWSPSFHGGQRRIIREDVTL